MPLFWRALAAFLLLPAVVAFAIPWVLMGPRPWGPLDLLGLVPFTLGAVLLLTCVVAFYRQGRGTLAPWDPPRHLVATGVYRWSRNPMYVGVLLILISWAVAWSSTAHAIYAVIVMLAFHLRVVLGEEPWLARTHGEAWTRYRSEVRRWF